MSTLVALTGFEFGTHAGIGFGNFDGVTGTLGTDVQVIAGAAYTGSYGLQVALQAKGPFWNTTTLGASKTAVVVAMRFRFSVLPTTSTDFISMDVAAGSDRAGFFFDSSTNKINAWISGGSTQASVATVSVNTWYTLEWKFDCSGTNTLDWKLDGVAGAQSTGGGSSTVARLQFGNRSAGTGTAQYDQIVVSSTAADYPLGNHLIKLLTVDPAGTVTTNSSTNFRAFTNNGTIGGSFNATDIRDAIDEVPPTIGASADGAVQISNNSTGYIEIPMTTYTLAGGETIAGVRMVACGWAADATSSLIGFRSYNGTTETVIYAVADPGFDASTTDPTWACGMLTLADVNTQAELDALAFRMGFSTDAAPDVGVHAIYAEVAVLPGGAGTVNADAALAVAATATAAAASDKPVAATLAVASALTAAATSTKPVTTTLTATAAGTAAASATKPATADLTATATRTATADSAKPVAATLTAAAALAAAATSTKPAAASLSVTATLTAAATVGTVPIAITAAAALTATLTAAAAGTRPAGAGLGGVATLTADAAVSKPATAALAVTATLTAAMSTTSAGLTGDIHGPLSLLPGTVEHHAVSLVGTIGD